MSVKKSRKHRFTWEDHHGKLRVVHIHVQHVRGDDDQDEVRVQLTGDGVPIEVDTYVEKIKPVKTRSRM